MAGARFALVREAFAPDERFDEDEPFEADVERLAADGDAFRVEELFAREVAALLAEDPLAREGAALASVARFEDDGVLASRAAPAARPPPDARVRRVELAAAVAFRLDPFDDVAARVLLVVELVRDADFAAPDRDRPDFAAPDFVAPDPDRPDFAALDFAAPDRDRPDFAAPDPDRPDFAALDFAAPDPGRLAERDVPRRVPPVRAPPAPEDTAPADAAPPAPALVPFASASWARISSAMIR